MVKAFFTSLGSPLEQLLSFEGINEIYRGVKREYPKDRMFFSACARSMNLKVDVNERDVAGIPSRGGLLIVANHPFGALDAIALGDQLGRVRSDFKVMANSLLAQMPETEDVLITVNPFGGKAAARQNISGMKQALSWLKGGGALLVFPAGEVSHFQWKRRSISDPKWSSHVAYLAQKAGVPVLPVYFHGHNSALFHFSGMVHPRLRTILLAREVMAKKNTVLRMAVGKMLPPASWKHLSEPEKLTQYFRSATYALMWRFKRLRMGRAGTKRAEHVPVAEVNPAFLHELNDPQRGEVLVSQGALEVRLCRALDFPLTLDEVGRLRELSFRMVGEGSGKARDLDAFDAHYLHLILWNREDQEIMGGYRIGPSDTIIAELGKSGLYTASLFKLRAAFFNQFGPALELGRSFVSPRYQKSYSALSLLWKGIGAYVVKNPRYARLFGPVSISADYHPVSQNLMVQFLRSRAYDSRLGRLVKATHPPRRLTGNLSEFKEISRQLETVDEVSTLVSYMEQDNKGVPVLLRQYLKMNARLLCFNVDPDFSNVLDGLMLSDLRGANHSLLERFLGRVGSQAFLRYHEVNQPVRKMPFTPRFGRKKIRPRPAQTV